jgi:molybdenum cofactor guanylyltransferase
MTATTPPDPSRVLGAVLAGGASRRMGRDKAAVEVGGSTMAARVVDALTAVAGQVVAVGRDGVLGGVPGYPDASPDRRGPLAGLVTALGLAGGRDVLLVAVDHPFVRTATLGALASLGDGVHAVVPEDGGHLQVACALYPGGWLDAARAEETAGGSIRSLLARMPLRTVPPAGWREWGEDGRSWFSVDDAAALDAGIARYL